MSRKKRLPKDAKPVPVSLTTADRAALAIIELRRSRRGEERDSPSEIVSDALWYFLVHKEKMPREQIEALLPEVPEGQQPSNIKPFPKQNNH
ncbi:MAG: hypothetical protein ACHP7P_05460 [Terriglobales bacterium]